MLHDEIPLRRFKNLSRWQATDALRRGVLVKSPCEECGAVDVQMHHEDYSRPCDVRWLCVDCHRRHHVGITVGWPGAKLPPDEMLSAIIRFGFRYSDIADRFDVNATQVSIRAKKLGFPAVSPGTHQSKLRPARRRRIHWGQHI